MTAYCPHGIYGIDTNVKKDFEPHGFMTSHRMGDGERPASDVQLTVPQAPLRRSSAQFSSSNTIASATESEPRRKIDRWDGPQPEVRHVVTNDGRCLNLGEKCLKLLTLVVVFLTVLAGIVINKGTLFFALSQIQPGAKWHVERPNATAKEMQMPVCIAKFNKTVSLKNGTVVSQGSTTRAIALPYNQTCASLDNKTNCFENRVWEHGNHDHREQRIYLWQDDKAADYLCETHSYRYIFCIYLIVCTPHLFTLLRCIWHLCFKSVEKLSYPILTAVMLVEFLSTIGVSLLVFYVLPNLPSLLHSQAMLASIGVVPSLLKIFHKCKPPPSVLQSVKKHTAKAVALKFLDILAFVSFILAIVLTYTQVQKYERELKVNMVHLYWTTVLSIFFIGVGFWENYVTNDTILCESLKEKLLSCKKIIHETRQKLYIFVSIMKIIVTFGAMVLISNKLLNYENIFNMGNCKKGLINERSLPRINYDWVLVWLVNILSGLVTYSFARSAVKMRAQIFSYALPFFLSTPVLLALLTIFCHVWSKDPCSFPGMPQYSFFKCFAPQELYGWVTALLAYVAQLCLLRHLWRGNSERLELTSRIFLRPLFDAAMIEQWMGLNRSTEEHVDSPVKVAILSRHNQPSIIFQTRNNFSNIANYVNEMQEHPRMMVSKDEIAPKIYACATMWHETEEEMIKILVSIFRLDNDQGTRRRFLANMKGAAVKDPDYYTMEAHIFFDDAMTAHELDQHNYEVNKYVKQLMQCVDQAASEHHKRNVKIPAPVKYPTPYGGRLQWILPGGNKLVAHLKDKAKARHKKRWSQVMYMYMFLGFDILEKENSAVALEARSSSTYILALDGDVDFEPHAVHLLLDIMKKSPDVGGVCGRIHPTGSGPMIWYQLFEYAIGHWLQKATEHIFGSVLCSPGCFSLFKGSALLSAGVMAKYAKLSTEAQHYIQYDQGEDRWLCTLLLQAGHRVLYSAAADAKTFAPEHFDEFFNQRRRWMPSTMANQMDLLSSWRQTCIINDYVSFPFVIYQTILFCVSLVGPGTIFMMMVGSIGIATKNQLPPNVVFLLLFGPMLAYAIVCLKCKPKTQLIFAQILTMIFVVVQIIVLVGLIVQMAQDGGTCTPTFFFFWFVGGTFIVSAILHPREFLCLVHGFTYFLSIPCMYMLLTVYSLSNLHVVSWGTREVVLTKAEIERKNQEKLLQEAKQQKKSGVLGWVSTLQSKIGSSDEEGFFAKLCCPRSITETQVISSLARIEETLKLYVTSQSTTQAENDVDDDDVSQPLLEVTTEEASSTSVPAGDEIDKTLASSDKEEEDIDRDEMVNPKWIEDSILGDGETASMEVDEREFFVKFIEKYLKPLVANPEAEERKQLELKELRNKMIFGFYLINVMLIVGVWTLQQNEDAVRLPWPLCNLDDWISSGAKEGTKPPGLEPVGFAFLATYFLVLCLQIIGMLLHRIGTLLHIISHVTISCLTKKKSQSDTMEHDVRDFIDRAKEFTTEDDGMDTISVASGTLSDYDVPVAVKKRRKQDIKLFKNMMKQKKEAETITAAKQDELFAKRFDKTLNNADETDRFPRNRSVAVRRLRQGTIRSIRDLRDNSIRLAELEQWRPGTSRDNPVFDGGLEV